MRLERVCLDHTAEVLRTILRNSVYDSLKPFDTL